MTTKETILGRIRSAIADCALQPSPIPPVPEVWHEEGLSAEQMCELFRMNLEAVRGEFFSCETLDQAVSGIQKLLNDLGAQRIAVMDRSLSRAVAENLMGKELIFAPKNAEGASAKVLSEVDASLVAPDFLLADTGSCVFSAFEAFDRLTTYIAPLSIVVADWTMLREHLPAAWPELKPLLESTRTGEMVVVTGPSRTADIEKILVLGVHGPKRLIVFLYDAI